jgi:hypothetical protein
MTVRARQGVVADLASRRHPFRVRALRSDRCAGSQARLSIVRPHWSIRRLGRAFYWSSSSTTPFLCSVPLVTVVSIGDWEKSPA